LLVEAPYAPATITRTVPAACRGVVTVSLLVDMTRTWLPAAPPNDTLLIRRKPLPVTVTVVPPPVPPCDGETLETAGRA
jgi:hypothetical protein